MDSLTHLSTDDLILFMDRELDQPATTSAQQHLLVCVDCGNRLKHLQNAGAAYREYHEQILKPDLQVPASGWARLSDRLTPTKQRWGWGTFWAAAAFAGTLAVVWSYFPMRGVPSAQDVIDKAQASPETPHPNLLFTSAKYRFARPAVLEERASEANFQHVQALFVQADYNWANPLSARSFAAWRHRLPDKRDFVTAMQEGGRNLYRVRTRTDTGVLRSATLTLEAVSYHPTRAAFEFQGEDLIEVSEQSDLPSSKPQETQSVLPANRPKVIETVAGPEDELRVFAALDAIGADAEDPIDVKLDAAHHSVLVTGMGMPAERRKQIETALSVLPNTVIRFSAGQPVRRDADTVASPDAGVETTQFRQKLQDMAGGARPLQTITDNALEISNALFAQSHSLLVLAQEFPPPVEATLSTAGATSLLALRQRHVGAMTYALRRLREQLKPFLLEDVLLTETGTGSIWQNTAVNLYEATRNLDRLVSRLMAGTYDEQTGEQMLKQLPESISKVDTLVLADSR